MKNKFVIFLNIFLLVIISNGCIEYNNSVHNNDLNVPQLYSSFDAPYSLNISSVSDVDNLTKVVYLNEERETIILTIQPISSTSSDVTNNMKIGETELYFRDFSGLYTYLWTIDGYTFSVVGTNKTIANDFVEKIIYHAKGW
ncbi:MAG: hypothetical protein P1P80_08700 [ANME-2 cluster archaeon]|nr:hypothetical protein [ANME-2 cluster archaeon]